MLAAKAQHGIVAIVMHRDMPTLRRTLRRTPATPIIYLGADTPHPTCWEA